MRRTLIVPAAGLGSRLRAAAPKALVPVGGRPMIDHLIGLTSPHVQHVVVVAHPSFSAAVRDHLARTWPHVSCDVIEQQQPTGMLDAILLATPAVTRSDAENIWIVWCDQVGILPATLARLAAASSSPPLPDLVVATVWRTDPYIHFDRDEEGRIVRVRQRREGDEMPPQGESDMGLFALSRAAFLSQLPTYATDVAPGRGTGERNFLPFIPWIASSGTVVTIPATDPLEALGINTPEDLAAVERWLRERHAPA